MKQYLRKISAPGESLPRSLVNFLLFLITPAGVALLRKLLLRQWNKWFPPKNKSISYHRWRQEHIQALESQFSAKSLTEAERKAVAVIATVTQAQEAHQLVSCLAAQTVGECNVLLYVNTSADTLRKQEWPAGVKLVDNSGDLSVAIKALECRYLLFLPEDSKPDRSCLAVLAHYIKANASTLPDVWYCNTEVQTLEGLRPHFKPGWSPHYLLQQNYLEDVYCISKQMLLQVLDDIEVFTPFNILSNLLPHRPAIQHIEEILVQVTQGSITAPPLPTIAVANDWSVSIIIPSKDQSELLQVLLQSIIEHTTGVEFEIIVVDNNSNTVAFANLVAEWTRRLPNFRCIPYPHQFNFSAIINVGAQHARCKYLLLLNNDMEVKQQDWLLPMLRAAQWPLTGAVGAKLLFGNGRIQHAGIVLGKADVSRHVYAGELPDSNLPGDRRAVVCNYQAVTGAALLVKKELFDGVGGMDEDLPVEYNDIAF
ncbi:MAG: glycosyltransferase, partial [Chitinophagia bacterium]|nr:glycosyltransferase [Chitinophagia bacterium]